MLFDSADNRCDAKLWGDTGEPVIRPHKARPRRLRVLATGRKGVNVEAPRTINTALNVNGLLMECLILLAYCDALLCIYICLCICVFVCLLVCCRHLHI